MGFNSGFKGLIKSQHKYRKEHFHFSAYSNGAVIRSFKLVQNAT